MPSSTLGAVVLALVAVGLTPPSLPAQTLYQENFDDGRADGLTPLSGAWEVVNGMYHVYTQGAQSQSASIVTKLDSDAWRNYHFECDVKVQGGRGHLVRFREMSPNDCYEIDVRGAPFNDIYLQKVVHGTRIYLMAVPYDNVVGAWHHLSVDVFGPHMYVVVDECTKFTYTDSSAPFLKGTVGVLSWAGGEIPWQDFWCDNLLVQILASQGATVRTDQTTWGMLKSLYR